MQELYNESIALHNLPATMLLGLVVLYWLMVLLGIADSDSEPMDVNGDGVPDVPAGSSGSGGFWPACGRFLHLGQVPLVVVGSFLAISFWVLSVLGNYFLNGEPGNRSPWVAVGLLVPNLLVSLLVTRIAAAPFRKLFIAMDGAAMEDEAVLEREGVVASQQVDARYGQVFVDTGSAPLLINARVAPGELPLEKGTKVVVTAEGPDHAYYFIKPAVPAESQSLQHNSDPSS